MDPRWSLSRIADLNVDDRAALDKLSKAVYPPGQWVDWPGRLLQWADPEWCVRIWGDDGELASYTGIVMRRITAGDAALRIGGVGGIKTHPAARGRGYARIGVRKALQFFHDQGDVEFALLVCEPDLVSYYSALGWSEFTGELLVTQHGNLTPFTFNRVMTHPVGSSAPAAGTINLCGAPW